MPPALDAAPLPAAERLAFPLDVPTLDEAEGWVERLAPSVGLFKVGLELFCTAGPEAVRAVAAAGSACFLDLKLHDIPATMAGAAAAVAGPEVRYLTVHAAAGPSALRAVREAVEGSGTKLLAVTVLTSLDRTELDAMGLPAASSSVPQLASVARQAGIDGFVCSPQEVPHLRAQFPKATLVTPGIRLAGGEHHGQKRVATPDWAIRAGADVLVVGRPIRLAADPGDVARAIVDTIAGSL